MKLSKAWCGLFIAGGTGLGLTAYFAQKGSQLCQSGATTLVNSILDASIYLSGINTTISVQGFPHPLQISLGELNFNLRHALTTNFVETLENMPPNASEACKGLI